MEELIFIPGHVPSSKNSRIFNATTKRSFHSKAVSKYIKHSKVYWKQRKENFRKLSKNKKPIHVGFHFIRRTKHKFDFINPLQTVQDCMQEFGFIDDDNMDELIPYPLSIEGKYYSVNPKEPGVIIKVL